MGEREIGSISSSKVELSAGQLFWHYSIIFFLLILPLMHGWDLTRYCVLDNYDGVRSPKELIFTSLPFIALSILFYFVQKRRLRFREFIMPNTNEAFERALKKTSKTLKWKIIEKRKDYARAYRYWSWSGSWGE